MSTLPDALRSPQGMPTHPGPRRHVRPWWHVLERLSIYMPALLMALLALGSYWLLRATPAAPKPEPERTVGHLPSDVMRGFAIRTFGAQGQLRAEVRGTEARRFADDGSMEMDRARIRSFSDAGVLTTAEADLVWTDAAHEHYVLQGNALVVRHGAQLPGAPALERIEFHGDHLSIWSDDRRVVSEQPVLLVRGGHRITAQSLDWSEQSRVAQLTGRVRAHLAAQPAAR
ncbi:MAG: LPS export ABC transporter periplasmic protein LptC [Burkholderiaceae bacterium]|nr:LPS export ABC transporter periplasmic protein LptC [Burkholderiaceae bacterium]